MYSVFYIDFTNDPEHSGNTANTYCAPMHTRKLLHSRLQFELETRQFPNVQLQ